MNKQDQQKQQAAYQAVTYVKSGMVLGLGTGSTTAFAIKRIGELLAEGTLTEIIGIPTSIRTEELARSLDIPLTSLDAHQQIDITIDGADEVDAELNLIKGGGGALLREKVVAQVTAQNIIIVDESKVSQQLGENWAVPIEVVPFALGTVRKFLIDQGAQAKLRLTAENESYLTDQNNLILDANFGTISDPASLSVTLDAKAGIVGHGLFVGLAHRVVVAAEAGVSEYTRE